ncbi:hypothetical protein GWN49_04255, partial [Candidatus Bathyarchaeota archaeon]|nr:sulfotransferase [Phycisphaerae bacterium]NIP51645.1 sulfotransferase [Phycisphaerae bacterium]NIV44082.1 hypothetical protein [Candidatus Bathyarchaeota archaeon]NIX28217.1 hypothetical protein [Phycisphaerae bacterium]
MKPTVSSGEVITSTEKRREPFFIVGFSRSGTTLLASLLNRHSRICVTPETRFCRGVMPCGRPDRRARSHEFI